MKINVKINTMQNKTFCFLFIHCPYTEGMLNAVWPNFRQVIVDTAVYQWRKRLQACVSANGGHFEHILLTNSCKYFTFSCVFGSSGVYPSYQLFIVDAW